MPTVPLVPFSFDDAGHGAGAVRAPPALPVRGRTADAEEGHQGGTGELVGSQQSVQRRWPLVSARTGERRIDRWCVAPNYRSAMIEAGDPILLWVSGDGRRLARGLWGAGRVTGAVHAIPGANGGAPAIPVDVEAFDDGISDGELRSAGLDDLEVQRQPMGSNPSWISTAQMRRLAPLLNIRLTQPADGGNRIVAPGSRG